MKIKRNPHIKYINPEVPEVTIKLPQGETYIRQVPDTLDLAERGKLAIHAMTHLVDDEHDYEFCFWEDFNHNPPRLYNDGGAVTCQYKYLFNLLVLRPATGSTERLEVDQRWLEQIFQLIGPDGLPYWHPEGHPWSPETFQQGHGWTSPIYGDKESGYICMPYLVGRLLGSLGVLWQQQQDERWKGIGNDIVDRFAELAIDKDDFAYFPKGALSINAKMPEDAPIPVSGKKEFALYPFGPGWLAEGLAHYYKWTGYPPALELAEKLVRYLMHQSNLFSPSGEFTGFPHFHSHTICVLAVAEVADITQKKEYQDFVWNTYKVARSMGDPLVGFYAEGHRQPDGTYHKPANPDYSYTHEPDPIHDVETSEFCEVADMMNLGIKLARSGHDECWDDVDRVIRNMFAECQMTESDWITDRLNKKGVPVDTDIPANAQTDNLPERTIGAFASWPSGNDFITEDHHIQAIMHCCTGNGGRVAYQAWENMIDYKDGCLTLHLLLNRASPWADVDSHIPYKGQVDIHAKTNMDLKIRIPQWAALDEVKASAPITEWQGRYAIIKAIKAGTTMTLEVPLVEKEFETTIGRKPYRVVTRGHDIITIDPPGIWCPFYQREHYRTNTTQWVERERFVHEEIQVRL